MKYLYLIVAGMCSVFFSACSCSSGIGGDLAAQIIGNKSESPVFLSCQAVSETEVNFRFSLPVKVVSLNFSPVITLDDVEDGDTVRVTYSDGPGAGVRITADLLVEDENANTINVLVTFLTRNDRIPPLLINEIRTEYSKPKCEFIELKTLQEGNLGALRVFIAGYSKAPMVYEFPPVEVAVGEYITLHLRTMEETNCDELGRNLEESGGADSSPTGRDLWIPGSTKLIHKTDIIYLLDQDDKVIDSVILSENADPWWSKDYFAEAAEFLFKAGVWQSNGKICSPVDAVPSKGTTLTRTICRDEELSVYSGTAADWYITANSSATPGNKNNPKRYN